MKENNELFAQQADSDDSVRVAKEEDPKEKSKKSPAEQRAAERQSELLVGALTAAADAKGQWLNTSGKLYPKFYPKGLSVSPFNAIVLALAADARQISSPFSRQLNSRTRVCERTRKAYRSCIIIGKSTSIATILMMSYRERGIKICPRSGSGSIKACITVR